ncbi:MAG: cephalosporin hydroxylase [Acutalibacter sp.]|nr:cephalosporin hydroxylase [Acutalibacter sp.]
MAGKSDFEVQFHKEKEENIRAMAYDKNTKRIGRLFMDHVTDYKYGYYFTWMGRPIIQHPQDIVALQEIIMEVRPDLIIETGVAHGGSLILSASMLELLDIAAPITEIKREVVGVDIEIRPHNRAAIEAHPMYRKITMLEGSSIHPDIAEQVKEIASKHKVIMVLLDSCHTADHVLAEMELYGPLVSAGSYMVVYDTLVEFEDKPHADRPWGKGNNPYTAVQAFLQAHGEFSVDEDIEQKIVLTSCPGGWLRRNM